MADKVEFELVSPERLLVSKPVEMVVVPGSEGDFGVLIGHAPLISTLRDGVIDLGAVATEFLILGIDPYPRKPGVQFEAPTAAEPGGHPFAALAALTKQRPG